ncbi:MAG: 2OG-Fe(II) oxygenase [Hyphomicrobiaceae bacterium]
MMTEALVVLVAASAAGIMLGRASRFRSYRVHARRVAEIVSSASAELGALRQRVPPTFAGRLACIDQVLPETIFAELRRQALGLVRPERSYIPTHKKGGTVAYESLFDDAPAIVALYHAREMQELISRIVGDRVMPTPISDQSSLSVLCYDKPGDHIGWHYDHNFYRGRHFTVLLPLLNEGRAAGGLSHATLMARIEGCEADIPTPPNTLIVFEGAKVHHKVTPILEGERRLVLSMTYCTDPRANALQGVARRFKDIAFYGPRALWT